MLGTHMAEIGKLERSLAPLLQKAPTAIQNLIENKKKKVSGGEGV